ncbi:MAG: glycosyltransferase [Oryzihumus sp.]
MSQRSLTILFMPESAYGPTNNCIGIGDVLRRRGHRVVFAAEASWKGRLASLGFEEELVELSPPAGDGDLDGGEQDAGRFWKDFIHETAPEFRKPTIEQLESFIKPTFEALIDGAVYCQPRLTQVVGDVRPDVVVEDNVVSFPALLTGGAPYVRIMSCNPLEVRGPQVPPTFSGLPSGERGAWDAFRKEHERTHRPLWESFNAWVQEQGAPALPYLDFVHTSEHLNLYVYPEAVDYPRDLGATWHRLESSVRATDAELALPDVLTDRPEGSALVYLSLGSLGSADVDLMKRLVDVLSRTPHRYIVSTGPCHREYELAENMWGREFLPQTTILPLVDLVLTHGGNNTTVEALHFGKPMVLLPLFWDQYDNAQRMAETGFGVRLDTYAFTEAQMRSAIDRLLGDEPLRARLAQVWAQIRSGDGASRAAALIAALAAG